MLDQHLAEKFVLFLENNDGPSWNKLATELCTIYARSREDSNIPYLANATAEVTIYAAKSFQAFAATEKRRFLHNTKNALIGFASGRIATDFFREFKIGNVY